MVTSRSLRFSIVRVAMMPGMAQAKQLSMGMNDFPCSPTLRHQPVHDERGARHVAGVLQDPEEEIEDENLREKDDDAAHAGDDAIGEQRAQIALGQMTRVTQSDEAGAGAVRASPSGTARR